MKKTLCILVIGLLCVGVYNLYAGETKLTVEGDTHLATTGGNVGIGTTSPRYKLEVNGTMKGSLIASNRNPVGLEFNILFNGTKRYLVSQTGPATFGLDALFDGRLGPSYPTNGPSPANPQVILIENLPASHTQAGAWVGWTTRYWAPLKFKLEGYDINQSANTWRVFADYSTTNYGGSDFLVPVVRVGIYTKLRLTIYEGSGSLDATGNKRVGLSEVFFIHPEATRPYAGLLPSSLWEVNGNVGIGTTSPTHRLAISGGPLWTSNGWVGNVELGNASSIAWKKDATSGYSFGIGKSHSGTGFYFWRSLSDVGDRANPAEYLMKIDYSTGNVGIGTTSPQAKLEVNSALRLTPSGAPANPKAGTIYFNATNKHFYGYDGAIWKQLD